MISLVLFVPLSNCISLPVCQSLSPSPFHAFTHTHTHNKRRTHPTHTYVRTNVRTNDKQCNWVRVTKSPKLALIELVTYGRNTFSSSDRFNQNLPIVNYVDKSIVVNERIQITKSNNWAHFLWRCTGLVWQDCSLQWPLWYSPIIRQKCLIHSYLLKFILYY